MTKKKAKENRAKNAGIALTPQEIKAIDQEAKKRGMSRSSFIRMVIKWFTGEVKEDIPDPPKE